MRGEADDFGASPLHAAAQNGHYGVLCTLVALGDDKDKPARNGQTPLHVAAQHGQVAVVRGPGGKGTRDRGKRRLRGDLEEKSRERKRGEERSGTARLAVLQADLDAVANGQTALGVASSLGNLDVVQARTAALSRKAETKRESPRE